MSYVVPGEVGMARAFGWLHHRCHGIRSGADGLMPFDLGWLQWPAMAVTVAAAWLVASAVESKRNWGFWLFMLSNLLWIAWGVHSGATALIVLQVCLAALNIRGAKKTQT